MSIGTEIDDRAFPSLVCTTCERLRKNGSNRSCEAYRKPFSIPKEIWWEENPHTEPFPGDDGLRFVLLGDTRPEDSKE